MSVPRTITVSISHLVILILTAFASFMIEGSITIFNLSFNLQSIPLSVIGISYSVAAFPTLVRLFSKGERNEFVIQVVSSMRHIIFWSFPALVLFIVLRAQIVRTIFGTGEFGWNETRLTAAALALFAVSIIAQSLVLLFVRGYYAAGHTRTPLFVNLFSSAFIIASSFGLLYAFNTNVFFKDFIEDLLRVSGIPGTAILMLPLAFSIGTLLNASLLWFVFKRDFAQFSESFAQYRNEMATTFRHSFYSSVFAGFAAFQGLRLLDDVFDINTFYGIFAQGLFSGILGIVVSIFILKFLRNKELEEIIHALKHRFWKEKPVVPDQTDL